MLMESFNNGRNINHVHILLATGLNQYEHFTYFAILFLNTVPKTSGSHQDVGKPH